MSSEVAAIPMPRMVAGDTAERRRAARVPNPAPQGPDRRTRRLVDISPFGCGLEVAEAAYYQAGQFVQMTFDDDLTIRAIVRWTGETRLGLEFTRPLASAEVETALTPGVSIGFNRL